MSAKKTSLSGPMRFSAELENGDGKSWAKGVCGNKMAMNLESNELFPSIAVALPFWSSSYFLTFAIRVLSMPRYLACR